MICSPRTCTDLFGFKSITESPHLPWKLELNQWVIMLLLKIFQSRSNFIGFVFLVIFWEISGESNMDVKGEG